MLPSPWMPKTGTNIARAMVFKRVDYLFLKGIRHFDRRDDSAALQSFFEKLRLMPPKSTI